jgi:cytoskeletal protein CcmA (bactofilin family)
VTQPVKQSASSEALEVIGQGMIIKGSSHSENDVFLGGEIEGDLAVENCRLMIGPHGKVVANVESTERTSIRTSGQLVGDVTTGGIVIESGALFKGKVEIATGLQQHQEARNGE